MIFIVIGIIIAIFIVFTVLCCLIVGARADSDNYQIKGKESMSCTCEYCNETFEWREQDALVKYKYGTKYIIHCPHCDKLIKIVRDKH